MHDGKDTENPSDEERTNNHSYFYLITITSSDILVICKQIH